MREQDKKYPGFPEFYRIGFSKLDLRIIHEKIIKGKFEEVKEMFKRAFKNAVVQNDIVRDVPPNVDERIVFLQQNCKIDIENKKPMVFTLKGGQTIKGDFTTTISETDNECLFGLLNDLNHRFFWIPEEMR